MENAYRFKNTIRVFKKDNVFQHLDVLKRNRVKRKQYNEIYVEGIQPIKIAMSKQWMIKSFVYSRERTLSDWAIDTIKSGVSENVIELPFELMQELSEKENTSEILAVVSRKSDSLSTIPKKYPFTVILMDRASNPGNLGTIIRTCDSFGVCGVILSGHSVDPYDPVVIRASVGTVFSVPVAVAQNQGDIRSWIAEMRRSLADLIIVGTSARGDIPIDTCDLKRPSLIIVGNESHGISDFFESISDAMVRIPLQGTASSLNVASATSIILYESYRQKAMRVSDSSGN